jgi:hypothetical protein
MQPKFVKIEVKYASTGPSARDPDLRIAARLDIGWSLLWSNRNADALENAYPVAAEASPRRPALAWDAITRAASVAHQTGLPEACAKVRAALDSLDAHAEPVPSDEWSASRADEHRIWITACTDPFGGRAETVRCLRRMAEGSVFDPPSGRNAVMLWIPPAPAGLMLTACQPWMPAAWSYPPDFRTGACLPGTISRHAASARGRL